MYIERAPSALLVVTSGDDLNTETRSGSIRRTRCRCRRDYCPECGPRKAERLALAIEDAGPAVYFVLDPVPEDLDRARQRMSVFFRALKRTQPVNGLWNIELRRTMRGDHLHVHGVLADPTPIEAIIDAAASAKFAVDKPEDAFTVVRNAHRTSRYLFKEVRDRAKFQSFMDRNGNKLYRPTGEFFTTSRREAEAHVRG